MNAAVPEITHRLLEEKTFSSTMGSTCSIATGPLYWITPFTIG